MKNKVKIKNYTSQVPSSRSVNRIEELLVMHGAKNILKIYDDARRLTGIAFIMQMPGSGNEMPFKLPAKVDKVEQKLRSVIKKPRKGTLNKVGEQAERTAWRLLSEWVEVQLSLVELDQAEFIEIFMPYIYNHSTQQTYFEKIKNSNYRGLLTSDTKEKQ
jgi:hypothetical protein